jgi:hypothetical protein
MRQRQDGGGAGLLLHWLLLSQVRASCCCHPPSQALHTGATAAGWAALELVEGPLLLSLANMSIEDRYGGVVSQQGLEMCVLVHICAQAGWWKWVWVWVLLGLLFSSQMW